MPRTLDGSNPGIIGSKSEAPRPTSLNKLGADSKNITKNIINTRGINWNPVPNVWNIFPGFSVNVFIKPTIPIIPRPNADVTAKFVQADMFAIPEAPSIACINNVPE